MTTVKDIINKKGKEKITVITAYDYFTSKLVDEAGTDIILVGDSLGMVVLGYDSTLSVTLEDIIYHTKAVKRGAKESLIVADMPFMSYNIDIRDTLINAGRIIKEGGAAAVKVEGGQRSLETIRRLVECQIPVAGHLGLTPQSVNTFGGYKLQGKDSDDAKQLIVDAKAVEEAGAFLIVLEAVPENLAKRVSEEISIPTIGIGAGKYTDGQVLVYYDMLGFSERVPKFVKKYANLKETITDSLKKYIEEVKSEEFPSMEYTYKAKAEI